MKKLLVFMFAVCLVCCCGCTPVGDAPVATSQVFPNPFKPKAENQPVTDIGNVDVIAEQPQFDVNDAIIGLHVLDTKASVISRLGEPPNVIKDAHGETLRYVGFEVHIADRAGGAIVDRISFSAPDLTILRDIKIGDSFSKVVNSFYYLLDTDESAEDFAVLYYSDKSPKGYILPPRGTVSFAGVTSEFELDGEYDQIVEYCYPLKPYNYAAIAAGGADFLFEDHVFLRFYFKQDSLALVTLSIEPFETVDDPDAEDDIIETPAPTPTPGAALSPGERDDGSDAALKTPSATPAPAKTPVLPRTASPSPSPALSPTPAQESAQAQAQENPADPAQLASPAPTDTLQP